MSDGLVRPGSSRVSVTVVEASVTAVTSTGGGACGAAGGAFPQAASAATVSTGTVRRTTNAKADMVEGARTRMEYSRRAGTAGARTLRLAEAWRGSGEGRG